MLIVWSNYVTRFIMVFTIIRRMVDIDIHISNMESCSHSSGEWWGNAKDGPTSVANT